MAEPAIGGNNLVGFDNNSNQNISVPIGRPFPIEPSTPPTTIPTENTNVTAVSQPIAERSNVENNIRGIENPEGEIIRVRIASFTKNGIIRVTGRYSQNYFDFDSYDLSVLNVIADEEVDFKFILCLKDGDLSIPQLYATKTLYETLVASYQYGNAIGVNDIIHERNIVVIDLQSLKQKVEDLRVKELSLDINLTNVSERNYVHVFRNLFVNSNYETNESNGLTASPTYNLIELFKYISWVVSKSSNNYDERLIPADLLGEFNNFEITQIPAEDEPSTQVNQNVDTNNNPAPPPLPTYPPIGREGLYDEDTAFYNGKLYLWDADATQWFEDRGDDIGGGS